MESRLQQTCKQGATKWTTYVEMKITTHSELRVAINNLLESYIYLYNSTRFTCIRGMMANEHITVASNSYEKVNTFKYLGYLLTNQNSIHEEIKCIQAGYLRYYSDRTLSSSWLLSKNLKIKIYKPYSIWLYMVTYINGGHWLLSPWFLPMNLKIKIYKP